MGHNTGATQRAAHTRTNDRGSLLEGSLLERGDVYGAPNYGALGFPFSVPTSPLMTARTSGGIPKPSGHFNHQQQG